jgi:hypothetical protein
VQSDVRTVQRAIQALGPLYQALRDPFYAWEAFGLAHALRDEGVAIPPWALAYLARVARHITAISRDEPTESAFVPQILKALEMAGHGRGAVFAKRAALRRSQHYALDVVAQLAKGHKVDQAVDSVAATWAVHRSTVLRAYQGLTKRGRVLNPGGWERRFDALSNPPAD